MAHVHLHAVHDHRAHTAAHAGADTHAHRTRYRPLPLGLPALLLPVGLGAVAILGCLYVGLVDPTSSGAAYPRCPFYVLTGKLCPGCGTARALHALLRGDLISALGFNLVAVLAIPYLAYLYVAWASSYTAHPVARLRLAPAWAMVPLVALIVMFAIVRNLPIEPFTVLAP